MNDEREKNLPLWARELIVALRVQIRREQETIPKDIQATKDENERLKRTNAALVELLTCAAKGGHRDSQAVIEVFESYSLTLTKD